MRFSYLDLFAGAGGLSEGFLRNGFIPVAHIEKDSWAARTLRTRLAYHFLKKSGSLEVYRDYISGRLTEEEFFRMVPAELPETVIQEEIGDKSFGVLVERIRNLLKILGIDRINVIVGGPPCQVYSTIGRNRIRCIQRMKSDPRTYLYRYYIGFLREFNPDCFVFENVPGIISFDKGNLWREIRSLFRDAGYEMKEKKLDAYDFGVLQKRIRVFVVGWRRDLKGGFPRLKTVDWHRKYSVRDLFLDLPPVEPGQALSPGCNYTGPPSEYLTRSGIRNGWNLLTLHQTRRHNPRDREIYRLAIKKWTEERKRLKYTDLPLALRTHRNMRSFLDRFKVVAADLPYSHTVVAHLEKDGHYFIHPDIRQLRSISVREAARIQGFPDDYYFEGPMLARFRQIGNAVPPLVASAIASGVKGLLKNI